MSAWYHCKTYHKAFQMTITCIVSCQHHGMRPDVICHCKRRINHFFWSNQTMQYNTIMNLMSMIIVIHLKRLEELQNGHCYHGAVSSFCEFLVHMTSWPGCFKVSCISLKQKMEFSNYTNLCVLIILWNWQQLKGFFPVGFHEISAPKSHVLYQSYIKSL